MADDKPWTADDVTKTLDDMFGIVVRGARGKQGDATQA